MTEFISNSYEETVRCAERLAKRLPKGSVIAFLGDLGAGKTAFTTGFVKGLGIEAEVASPTFAICNVYRGNGETVCHYDMYRIETWEDLYTTGFLDRNDEQVYSLVEWSENIYHALPDDAVIIRITKTGENTRNITVMKKEEADLELDFSD